jgi:hypothetical protein
METNDSTEKDHANRENVNPENKLLYKLKII